jgi:hypothetical protein
LKTEAFPSVLALRPHVSGATKNGGFQKRSPEWRLERKTFHVYVCTGENGGFRKR